MPNTYVALRTETVAVATNSVTFDLTGISGYTDLKLEISAIAESTAHHIFYRVNSDSGTNYSWTNVGGDGSTAGSARASNQPEGRFTYAAAVRTGAPTQVEANFESYASSSVNKVIISRNGRASDGVEATVNLWRSNSAITSINLFTTGPNFGVGSTFSLYGIANADQGSAKATGGIITEDST